MFRKGWISHQRGYVLGYPVKQFQREKLKIHNSEFLSKRGLVFLKPQVHPKGKEARLLRSILTWLPWILLKASTPPVSPEEMAQSSMLSAVEPAIPGEWDRTWWYTRPEPAIGYVKAVRVGVRFATFGACLLYPSSERRTILRSQVTQN